MRTLCSLFFFCLTLFIQAAPNYTIIVSLDGFRWDYPNMYHTPNLAKMSARGVEAESMLPSYPASTFPNHYTLATGLVPDHHGIINNSFWDNKEQVKYSMGDSATRNNPKYYGGEPIWITAQKQGIKTANLYWVSSDIPVKQTFPNKYKVYAQKPRLTLTQRVDSAVAWFQLPEQDRPQLIMLYIEEPDGVGHKYGPKDKQTGIVVHYIDSVIGDLIQKIDQLPIASQINVIVTSDHGMTEISPDRLVRISDYIKPSWCKMIDGSSPTSIFTQEGCRDSVLQALANVPHIRAYRKEQAPPELNYGTNDRIGDVVVSPDCGWQFAEKARDTKGAHGYSPLDPDMQVIFRAYGPDFKKGYISKPFLNVDIYPLLSYLLQITPEPCDGDFNRVANLLKNPTPSKK